MCPGKLIQRQLKRLWWRHMVRRERHGLGRADQEGTALPSLHSFVVADFLSVYDSRGFQKGEDIVE